METARAVYAVNDVSLDPFSPGLQGFAGHATSGLPSLRDSTVARLTALEGEQGNINTPLELAIRNQTDRFSLAIDAIDRIPRYRVTGSSAREALLDQQIACKRHAYEFGVDPSDITNWQWAF